MILGLATESHGIARTATRFARNHRGCPDHTENVHGNRHNLSGLIETRYFKNTHKEGATNQFIMSTPFDIPRAWYASRRKTPNFDDLHVGPGIPSFDAHFIQKNGSNGGDASVSCGTESACSSMCSAASTVASALSSMNSVSFLASSKTTFDLARNVALRFSIEAEQNQVRKRALDSEPEVRVSANPGRHCPDYIYPCQGKRARHSQPSADYIEQWDCDLSSPVTSSVEEYSIGPGNPYTRIDKIFLSSPMTNKYDP